MSATIESQASYGYRLVLADQIGPQLRTVLLIQCVCHDWSPQLWPRSRLSMQRGSISLGAPHGEARLHWGTVDLDGNPRFNADELDFDPGCGIPVVVDMGAYEYQFDPVEDVIFADLNGDGVVGILDLLGVLAAWGDAGNNCLADLDINDDATVGILDLLVLLANWGGCQ